MVLGKKAMGRLSMITEDKDASLKSKLHLFSSMVFLAMCGCQSCAMQEFERKHILLWYGASFHTLTNCRNKPVFQEINPEHRFEVKVLPQKASYLFV